MSIFLNETKILVFGSLKIFQINTKLSRRPKTCPSSPTRGNKPSDLKINSIKSSKVTSIISIKNSNRKCQSKINMERRSIRFRKEFNLNRSSFSHYLFYSLICELGFTRRGRRDRGTLSRNRKGDVSLEDTINTSINQYIC